MKNIILGVTGSIAAYKAAEIIRQLRQQHCDVQVVMTQHAQAFITPLTLQALSEKSVLTDWCGAETQGGMDHIALAKWADAILIAPGSANILARLAHGITDDLLTTLCLATSAPLFIAPAMNPHMWSHPATKNNAAILKERGVHFLGPDTGSHACGDEGLGRMLDPIKIVEELLSSSEKILSGEHVLITAGPTQEKIDPVRYISNYSSGKMGFALAEAALDAGAKVSVISGPCSLSLSSSIQRINVKTAEEMRDAVLQYTNNATIFIGAAAVADYQNKTQHSQKIKKEKSGDMILELTPTPDILSTVTHLPHSPFAVGFCLETQDLEKNALQKLKNKKLDIIFANTLSEKTGFDVETNAGMLFYKNGKSESFSLMSKTELAKKIIACIHQAKTTH